jgi:hypothetical protein
VNGGKEELEGCLEYLGIMVEGVPTYTHAFVVKSTPYWLMLGRPWQSSVRLQKVEKGGGVVEVVVTDPRDAERKIVVVPTKEWKEEKTRRELMVLVEEELGGWGVKEKENTLTEAILTSSYTYNPRAHCLTYKSVANKARNNATRLPYHQKVPEDPIDSLPHTSPHPPLF